MSEYARRTAGTVTIAIILAAIVGGVAIYSFPGSPSPQTVTASTSSSTTTVSSLSSPTTVSSLSSSVTSATLPCGSPGVYCGGFQIMRGSLTVNNNSSVLQITLQETGNMWIGSATVYLNGTVLGVPSVSQTSPPGNIQLNIQPGQSAVLVLTIPKTTVQVLPGKTYTVSVNGWEGPPGEPANSGDWRSINVTAT